MITDTVIRSAGDIVLPISAVLAPNRAASSPNGLPHDPVVYKR